MPLHIKGPLLVDESAYVFPTYNQRFITPWNQANTSCSNSHEVHALKCVSEAIHIYRFVRNYDLIMWRLLLMNQLLWLAGGELLGAIVVSRHGTRAPNVEVEEWCPGLKANAKAYRALGVAPGGLTGKGMQELFEMGKFVRARYIHEYKLLPESYHQPHLRCQAVATDRTLQSAAAWGQGLYPAGSSPSGYNQNVPTPLAVFSAVVESDDLLEARNALCKSRLALEVEHWDRHQGKALLEKHKHLIHRLSDQCGRNLLEHPNEGDILKDITDAATMDYYMGLPPLGNLTFDDLHNLRRVAVHNMFGRLYYTDEQKTYMAGLLPTSLVTHFETLLSNNGKNNAEPRLHAFHGHREIMHALAFFLNVSLYLPGPTMPYIPEFDTTAIPPTTTFIFELHKAEQSTWVNMLVWRPCNEDKEPNGWPANMGRCEPILVRMGDCELHCPYDKWKAIIHRRIKRTSHYEKLCSLEPHRGALRSCG